MPPFSHRIRLSFGILLVLITAWPLGPVPQAGASPVLAATPQPNLEAFQRVTPTAGWVLLDQRLHWTDDGGRHWIDLTPADLGPAPIQAVHFSDEQQGWLVTVTPGDTPDPTYTLFHTTDGGRAWTRATLALFAPDDMAALAGAVYLDFVDAATGWLVVRRATSSAFNEGTLFQTTDGGATWTRLALPAGEPVHFASAREGWLEAGPPEPGRYVTQDGGATWTLDTNPATAAALNAENLSDLSLASGAAAWARSAEGKCEAGACELVTQLLATADGGQTWTPVTLPGGRAALVRTFGAAGAPEAASAATASQSALTLNYNGHGFDSCTKPTLDQMQTWYLQSPYRVWNLYIGGSARSNCGTLTHGYVQSLAQQGWLFIPTWVGPQPPCSDRVRRMSWDPALAANEGIIEAYLALDVAAKLGLTLSNQSGTIIYYDVENYPNNAACRDAAKAFLNAWTATLHGKGSLSGVYGGPCSSYMSDLAGIANVPDAVWLAAWNTTAFSPTVSVFGLNCVSDSLWSQSQRLRQYTGGHNETYGDVLINIDSDVTAGPLATVLGACAPGNGQVALFVHPNFGGQCVVKNLGDYPTPATLNILNDSTSSLRLGPNVRLQICRDDFYLDVCQDFLASDVDLSDNAIGDNQVSSAKVISYSPTLTVRMWLPLNRLSAVTTSAFPNGNFESGANGWTTSSTRGRQPIVDAGTLSASSVAPHGGSWAAWLGNREDDDPNNAAETTTLGQIVTVPAAQPYLTYWHWIKSSETGCYYDIASVWVNNNVVESYALCSGANTNGWAKQAVDLHAFAGSTVALRLQVDADGSLLSRLFVDDLAFQSMP